MCNRTGFNKNWNHHHHHAHKFRNFHEHPRTKTWKEHFRADFNNPPANVRELDDNYELHLFAPGYEKSDFLIALIDQNLSISVDAKKEEDQTAWKRREYTPQGFVRQFELNEKIDKSAIEAKYENGVLILSLPKLEGFETERQEIEIS